jgi:hypothetical protein
MEVFMKTMKQFALAGITVFLALFLVTCGADLSGGGGGGEANVEYSDWEYVQLPNGSARLTLYLDGSTPIPSTSNNRALNHDIAKRSHDFFEAVFMAEDGTVARANWEIGQPAGIRGVRRGYNYAANPNFVTTLIAADPSATPNPIIGTGRATVFVGRKASSSEGTLLAVGFLTHIEGQLITGTTPGIIRGDTTNVTFTVSPLETKVGFDFSGDDYELSALSSRDTFWTSALEGTQPGTLAAPATSAYTAAGVATFRNKTTFTIFNLPVFDRDPASPSAPLINNNSTAGDLLDDYIAVGAQYQFGGLNIPATHSDFNSGAPLDGSIWQVATTGANLADAIFVYPYSNTTNFATPRERSENNFQVIERLGIYSTLGQRYDVDEVDLDTETTVRLHSSNGIPSSTPNYDAIFDNNVVFNPKIPLEFRIKEGSGGVFAITFQVPVYALAKKSILDSTVVAADDGPVESTNTVPYIKWYIRPAHQQQQYLLDNGLAAGGAVLMGVGVGSLDWIEIITKGLGFTN